MKYAGGRFILDSGRDFYAHGGILGLNEDLDDLYYGYDGCAMVSDEWHNRVEFTGAERDEIAAYMIDLWTRWRVSPRPHP